MSKNDAYTTVNLLDYSCHQNYNKSIGIDLLRQTNRSLPQKTNLIGKLEEDHSATNRWKAAKNYFKLLVRFINCNRII